MGEFEPPKASDFPDDSLEYGLCKNVEMYKWHYEHMRDRFWAEIERTKKVEARVAELEGQLHDATHCGCGKEWTAYCQSCDGEGLWDRD